MNDFSSARLKTRAIELGFTLVGIAHADPSPMLAAYERWIAAGMHADMGYMARADRVARRRDLNMILPGVRSMIVAGLDYSTFVPDEVLNDPSRGRIAAYAWGLDYHAVLMEKLDALAKWIAAECGTIQQRAYVDTGAILERSHAHTAGLGFIGKNTMLIHPRRGSMFFLGELLTDITFDSYDTPSTPATMCGRCTRCLSACPTNAFPSPHVLDARRCISYWTIENKGAIPSELRANFGNWIYGCDICQDICPFQRFAPRTAERAFSPADIDRAAPKLADILALDEATFSARYAASPIARIKRDRLIRNACIAAGNSGDQQLRHPLERLQGEESLLIRDHATWALDRLSERAKIEARDSVNKLI